MQKKLFTRSIIGELPSNELLRESHEIVAKAIVNTDPYAIVLMLSGGDDSITALHVAVSLGIKIDFIMHGVTGTGLPACRKYVHEVIILLNGVRVEESDNRADNFGDNPYRWRKNQYWVNIIHWFTKKQCLGLLEAENVQRSPVAIALGRSGECNCGTVQSEADRILASEFDPEWGKWMYNLRREITAKFGWDITQNPSKARLAEIKQENLALSEFMPMCVGCKSNYKLFE